MRWLLGRVLWRGSDADEKIDIKKLDGELIESVAKIRLYVWIANGIIKKEMTGIFTSMQWITSIWSNEFDVLSWVQEVFALQSVQEELSTSWLGEEEQKNIISIVRKSIRAEFACNLAQHKIESLQELISDATALLEKARDAWKQMTENQDRFNQKLKDLWVTTQPYYWERVDFLWPARQAVWEAQRHIATMQWILRNTESMTSEIKSWADEQKAELEALRSSTNLKLEWQGIFKTPEADIKF